MRIKSEEMIKAIGDLKNRRVAGEDAIIAETLKYELETVIEWMQKV